MEDILKIIYGDDEPRNKTVDDIYSHLIIMSTKSNNINKQNDVGWTLLMLASFMGKSEYIKELLEIPSIDCNLKNNNGHTALMIACMYSDKYSNNDTVELLLSSPKVDVNVKSAYGKTALMIACHNKSFSNKRTRELLLVHPDIDINAVDNVKCTALMYLCMFDCGNIDYFLNHYPDLNKKDDCHYTALKYACLYSPVEVVTLLLKYGANASIYYGFNMHFYEDFWKNKDHLFIMKAMIEYLPNISYISVKYKDLVEDEKDARMLLKVQKFSVYDNVLRGIGAQDAKIRFKPGNMGHKIATYSFSPDFVSQEDKMQIMHYLHATEDNLDKQVDAYLQH
jgi:hypothetical protein